MRYWFAAVLAVAGMSGVLLADAGGWLAKVPDGDRERANPVAEQADAIAAGGVLYQSKCAKCHGAEANGRHGLPSLRTERVAKATDGEIAWLLEHGSPENGMPAWNRLPEDDRWRLVAYVKSLGPRAEMGSGPK